MNSYPDNEDKPMMLEEPAASYASPTIFNPSQQLLLRMFAYDSSQEGLLELQQVLTAHYRAQADQALNELWESGKLNQEKLNEIRGMHLHDLLKE